MTTTWIEPFFVMVGVPSFPAVVPHYLALGFPVFPIEASKKPPRGLRWKQEAVSELAKAEALWREYGSPRVAIPCGPASGVLVLDLDVKNGEPGEESLAEALDLAGMSDADLETLSARTPSGGTHYFFEYDEGLRLKNWAPVPGFPGLDLRTEGGYVGVHSGLDDHASDYQWNLPSGTEGLIRDLIRPIPPALVEALLSRQSTRRKARRSWSAPRFAARPEDRGACTPEQVRLVSDALPFLDARDHQLWVSVGLCLAFHLPEEQGWSLFDRWSATCPAKYRLPENLERWQSFVRSSQGAYTIEWLLSLARRHYGWPDPAYQSPVPDGVQQVVSVDDAGPTLQAELQRALETVAGDFEGTGALLYAPMGAGKTHAAVEVLARSGVDVLFALPNHGLVREVEARLISKGVPVVVHRGVGEACEYKEAYQQQGRPIDWKQTACRGCPLRSQCDVFEVTRRLERGEELPLILTVHAAVPSLMRKLEGRVVLFDELPDTIQRTEVDRQGLSSIAGDYTLPEEIRWAARQVSLMLEDLQDRALARAKADGRHKTHGLNHQEVCQLLVDAWNDHETTLRLQDVLIVIDRHRSAGDPEQLRSGVERLQGITRFGVLLEALLNAKSALAGGTLQASLRRGQFYWSVALRAERPERVVIMDGTASFSRGSLTSWLGREPLIFGADVEPRPSTVHRHLYLGRRFNRGFLASPKERDRSARFLVDEITALATEHFPGQPFEEVLAVIVPKSLADYLGAWQLLPKACIGYFGRDDTGTNRFEGRPLLVTAGDWHHSVGVLQQEAHCLSVDFDAHVQDRRCTTLIQAGARTRWMRSEGTFVDVHFGSLARPGWSSDNVNLHQQPNDHDAKQALVEELKESARALARTGVPVSVSLLQAVAARARSKVTGRTIRDRVLKPLFEEEAIERTSVRLRGPGGAAKEAMAAVSARFPAGPSEWAQLAIAMTTGLEPFVGGASSPSSVAEDVQREFMEWACSGEEAPMVAVCFPRRG
ncbi:bifunctional DNA primase/polymerase [Planctomycetota bacterium]|nr:bifunctional DNA primase/polymerase [Planctomycetota bacterium]